MRSLAALLGLYLALVLAPVAYLVWAQFEALNAARYELEARQREDAAQRARRAGEELLERVSEVLAREEGRGVFEYQYAFVPDNVVSAGANVARSPLAEFPANEYAAGYFQLDAGGSVSSPHLNGLGTVDPVDAATLPARRGFLTRVEREVGGVLAVYAGLPMGDGGPGAADARGGSGVPPLRVADEPPPPLGGGAGGGGVAAGGRTGRGGTPLPPATEPSPGEAQIAGGAPGSDEFFNTANFARQWGRNPSQGGKGGKEPPEVKRPRAYTPDELEDQRQAPARWEHLAQQQGPALGQASGFGLRVSDQEGDAARPLPERSEGREPSFAPPGTGSPGGSPSHPSPRPEARGPKPEAHPPSAIPTPPPAPLVIECGEFNLLTGPGEEGAGAGRQRRIYAWRLVSADGMPYAVQGFELSRDWLHEVAEAALARQQSAILALTLVADGPDTPADGVAPLVRQPLGPALPLLAVAARVRDAGAIGREIARRRETFQLAAVAGGVLVVGAGVFLLRAVASRLALARRQADFVSAVTHELKTPLTSIRMRAEMLRDGWVADPDKTRRYYDTILNETERLSRLITNVLDFSRLANRSKKFQFQIGDLGAAVREVCETLRPCLEESGARLVLDLEEGLPARRFDRDALAQVVVNLVDNAVKYSAEARDRTVTVRLTRRGDGPARRAGSVSDGPGSETGNGVALEVIDHGVGIARADRARIFEKFFRVGNELTRKTQGTGIGLALVAQYVAAHRGRIEVDSEPGRGSTFRVLWAS